MDTTLLALLAIAIGAFVLRMVYIAWTLKRAAKHPGEVDPTALREAQKLLTMHKDLRREAVREPRRQLRAAQASVEKYRRIARASMRRPSVPRTVTVPVSPASLGPSHKL